MKNLKLYFYSSNAPNWWPYQVLSLSNNNISLTEREYYHVIIDNGMFNYVSKNQRPDTRLWIWKLKAFTDIVYRRLKPRSITVITPDWIRSPEFTLEAARIASNVICKDYECMLVAHYNYDYTMDKVISEAFTIDNIRKIAVPCKLYCSVKKRHRRVVNYPCQKILCSIAYSVVKERKLLHALGLGLKLDVVKSISKYVQSFDSTSWTRPVKTIEGKRYSAKTAREREQYFILALNHLKDYIYIPSEIIDKVKGIDL